MWVFLFVFSDLESGGVTGSEGADLGFSKWLENIKGKPGLWVSFCFWIYFAYVIKLRTFILFVNL